MKQLPKGPFLVALGIFGGGLFWMVLIGFRFEYLITVVYNGFDPGESIWALDPVFILLATIPGVLLIFAGLVISSRSGPKTSPQRLNLFYIGEISLLVTIITSIIGFLGTSSIVIDRVFLSTVMMGIIALTGCIHIFSLVISKSVTRIDSLKLARNAAIILFIELVTLTFVVVSFRLYTWSLITSTTLVITLSGGLGLLLLIPRFLNLPRMNSVEDSPLSLEY